MRKRLLGGISTVVLGTAALAGCSGSGGDDAGTLKIGVVTPLTGGAASYGTQFQKGIELAVDEINGDGGIEIDGSKVEIEVEFCDDQFVANKSVTCGRKLAEQGDAVAILTPGSVSAFPLMGFNEKDEFILAATSQTPSFTTQGNGLVVRLTNDITQTMSGFTEQLESVLDAQGLSHEKTAIMEVNTELGASWVDSFEENWEGEVVGTTKYDANATDFTNQIQGILDSDPDVIVLTTVCQPSALAVKQAREAGFTGVFVNSSACPGGTALTEFVDPALVAGQFFSESGQSNFPASFPQVQAFVDNYTESIGEAPTETTAPIGYETIHWLALAAEAAGSTSDAKAIHDAFEDGLKELGDANLTGKTGFDSETGNVEVETVVGVTGENGALTAAEA